MSAWGCRSCPTPGCRVLLGPEGLVWGVASGSKGSEPPEGWQDPNRGWAGNRTFVKRHLDELLRMHSPDVALFSHDWAPTKAMLVLNCPEVPPEAYAGIAPIFERSHPGFILATDTSQKAAEAMAETTEEVAEKATHAALSASGKAAAPPPPAPFLTSPTRAITAEVAFQEAIRSTNEQPITWSTVGGGALANGVFMVAQSPFERRPSVLAMRTVLRTMLVLRSSTEVDERACG